MSKYFARNWQRLLALASLAFLIGGLGFLEALANVARQTVPSLVARNVPFDAQAPTIAADELMVLGQRKLTDPEVAAAGRATLLREPLNARALRILGLVADDKGNGTAAQRFMTLSSRVSRRELGTQLWLIENAVRRNNVPETLRQYDITLRGIEQSKQILYPVLLASLSDPTIRRDLIPFVKQDPPWLLELLNGAVSMEKETEGVADLLARAGGLPRTATYKGIEASLISQLVAQRKSAQAFAFFRSIPLADRSALDIANLSQSTVNPLYVPLTWSSLNSPTIQSNYVDAKQGLQIAVSPGAQGTVIARVTALVPGNYILESTLSQNQSSKSKSYLWQVDCETPKRYTGLWNSGEVDWQRNPKFRGTFVVPADCPTQRVSLYVKNNDPGMDVIANLLAVGFRRGP